MCDEDMTPEEWEAAWAKAEPVELTFPSGGIKAVRTGRAGFHRDERQTWAAGTGVTLRWS